MEGGKAREMQLKIKTYYILITNRIKFLSDLKMQMDVVREEVGYRQVLR